MVHAEAGAVLSIDVPAGQQAGFYLLDGSLQLTDGKPVSKYDFLRFSAEGGEVGFTVKEPLRGLWLAGEPIDEPVVSHGPFVMNTTTEIMEAMRDYQMGKMGMLLPS
jgi:redox-sensitive bicupin YhaK (pirin superfamily)